MVFSTSLHDFASVDPRDYGDVAAGSELSAFILKKLGLFMNARGQTINYFTLLLSQGDHNVRKTKIPC